MPQIEWKLDVGHVITIVALIISGAIAWGSMSNKLDQYSQTLVEVRTELKDVRTRLEDVQSRQIRTETELKIRQEAQGGGAYR